MNDLMSSGTRRWLAVVLAGVMILIGLAASAAWATTTEPGEEPTVVVPVNWPCGSGPGPGPTPSTTMEVHRLRQQAQPPPPVVCSTEAGQVRADVSKDGVLCVTVTPSKDRPRLVKPSATDGAGNAVNLKDGIGCVKVVNGKGRILIKGEVDWHPTLTNKPYTIDITWDAAKGWATYVEVCYPM